MKKKIQEKKKLSLDKLQVTKINNLNKVFGGLGNLNAWENIDNDDEPSKPPVKDGNSIRG
ncbi:hypothetical protein [Chryseobacterium paridis]|uniref:Bacteriocin n=1 Tax=Chryseobacterium paridis TaxID=2800328 RepID=A0ABS1FUW7_9FLAO|nr:hypothetical protein [Chryseobacterium paridis]MBK1896143.1 hypothetical protein [Chryseobacterium paridis]